MATRAPGTFPGALAPVCAAAAEPEPVPAVDGAAAAAAAEEDEEDEEDDDELLLLLLLLLLLPVVPNETIDD